MGILVSPFFVCKYSTFVIPQCRTNRLRNVSCEFAYAESPLIQFNSRLRTAVFTTLPILYRVLQRTSEPLARAVKQANDKLNDWLVALLQLYRIPTINLIRLSYPRTLLCCNLYYCSSLSLKHKIFKSVFVSILKSSR